MRCSASKIYLSGPEACVSIKLINYNQTIALSLLNHSAIMSTISSAITVDSVNHSLGVNPSPPNQPPTPFYYPFSISNPYHGIIPSGLLGNPLFANAGHTPFGDHTQHAMGPEPSTPSPTVQMPTPYSSNNSCGTGSVYSLNCSESIGHDYEGSSPWDLWTNRSYMPARRADRLRAARYESSAENPFGF